MPRLGPVRAHGAHTMSAVIVDFEERRRVRELASALAAMAKGRGGDLVAIQHLMIDEPGLAHALVRLVLTGQTTLPHAAAIARRWLAQP